MPQRKLFKFRDHEIASETIFWPKQWMLLGGQTTDLIMHEHLLSDSEILSFAAIS